MKEDSRRNIEEQAAVFSALADPTRLRLVRLLCRQHERDALCVNALAGLLGVSQPAVSQHLRVLKAMELVNGERRGYHIHYFVNLETLKHYRELVLAALSMQEPAEEKSCQYQCKKEGEQNVSRD
jgi:ArsR family transcriptional regulator